MLDALRSINLCVCTSASYERSTVWRAALSVGVIVNNLRDSRPPADRNGGGWPFYPVGNYDPYGRQYWLQLDYRFR